MPGGYKRGWVPLEKIERDFMHPMYREHPEIAIWTNGRYEVICHDRENGQGVGIKYLSIKLLDRSPVRNWRHLQQIKNEVCGEEWTGIEIFPPESRLTDSANQYHLFCYPPEIEFGIGLDEESVVSDDETVEAFNADPNHKGQQEPWEEGLTTGRTDASADSRERMREMGRSQYGYNLP